MTASPDRHLAQRDSRGRPQSVQPDETDQGLYYVERRRMEVAVHRRSAPATGEVQIEVAYNGICGTDLHIFHGDMDDRVDRPAIIGHEMSGMISEVGPHVDGWAVGDHVTVMPLDWCGSCPACAAGHHHICHNLNFVGIDSCGALQQRWNVRAEWLVRLDPALPLDVAALTEPLAVAIHDVRRGEVEAGHFVVVIGGGPIGVLIGLVARTRGAAVLVSEPDAGRRELISALGMQAVDPTESDVGQVVAATTGGAGADVAFEVSGSAAGAAALTQVLKVRGVAVVVGIHTAPPPVDLFQVFWRELEVRGARVYERCDFEEAAELLTTGVIPAEKIITRVVPAREGQNAFESLEAGGATLKILIDCREDAEVKQ